MGRKGECVFQITPTKTMHARECPYPRVSVRRVTHVGKSRGVLCVHMAVPMCHVDAVCLCARGSMSERGGGTSACRSRSMMSVRISNTHLRR